MGLVLRDYLETVDAQAMFALRAPRFKGPTDKIAQLPDTFTRAAPRLLPQEDTEVSHTREIMRGASQNARLS
jgi:hypothetical protein